MNQPQPNQRKSETRQDGNPIPSRDREDRESANDMDAPGMDPDSGVDGNQPRRMNSSVEDPDGDNDVDEGEEDLDSDSSIEEQ